MEPQTVAILTVMVIALIALIMTWIAEKIAVKQLEEKIAKNRQAVIDKYGGFAQAVVKNYNERLKLNFHLELTYQMQIVYLSDIRQTKFQIAKLEAEKHQLITLHNHGTTKN